MLTIVAAIVRPGADPNAGGLSICQSPWFGAWLTLGALLSLASLLVPVLSHRRMRMIASVEAPEKLLTPHPTQSTWYAFSLILATLVAIAAALPRESSLRPIALFITTLVVSSIGHISRRSWIDFLGLGFACWLMVSIAVDWLPLGGASGLFGVGAAGFLMFWFSRFWQQQLLDGQAWTTTGRLVSKSALVAHAMTLVALGLSIWVGYAHLFGVRLELVGPVAGGITAFVLAGLGAALVFTAHQSATRAGFVTGVVSVLSALLCAARTMHDARQD